VTVPMVARAQHRLPHQQKDCHGRRTDCSDGGAGTTSTTALAEELSWPTSCECSNGGTGTTSTSAPAEGLSWPTNCDCSDSGAGTTLTTTLAEEPSWPTSFAGVDVSHMPCNTTKPDILLWYLFFLKIFSSESMSIQINIQT